ncbi:hypothetical protein K6119_00585 [Paracrocinitomix mangrovi]|uniref:hypothetical protein n=1 Tax=Paracrocinitomix mangrovi TaxID=2862509 RepID=UPI001C8DDF80|nr:hypothetical protein [Paracrocinitomix mangrovi]UKN02011.1 hypothetical protein K6119_00585 [Paracrocinitomix mangrovi]
MSNNLIIALGLILLSSSCDNNHPTKKEFKSEEVINDSSVYNTMENLKERTLNLINKSDKVVDSLGLNRDSLNARIDSTVKNELLKHQ